VNLPNKQTLNSAYLTGLKNAVEVSEQVLAHVVVARADEEEHVDDSEQRQQNHCRSYCFPNNDIIKHDVQYNLCAKAMPSSIWGFELREHRRTSQKIRAI